VARNGIWRRQFGQVALTGATSKAQATIGQPGPPDGFTLVRNIGSVTVNLNPNTFTGESQVWLGLAAGNVANLDPATPMNPPGFGWLWWDYLVIGPRDQFGPASADHRWGASFVYRQFDVHGFRIMNPASEGDFFAFYATQLTSGDPPAVVRVSFGISSFFLGPP
jgi:hypothetical protein